MRQNRTFRASGSNPEVLAACDQNMQKPLYVRLNRTLPFKCKSRSVGCLCIITCRNHCISMSLLKTFIIYLYVTGVDPLSVLCSYGEKFVADWSDQLG